MDSYIFTRIVPKPTFMTSLEVIREVMNVPMEAVHAIARMNGISTADNHELNIPESKLHPFVEAFERKTRNYFVNSMRNRAQLTPQELQTFTEFCKTFKKGNVSLGKVSNWSHIGKARLREYFVDKIKEKTPSSRDHHTILDLFSGTGGIDAIIERAVNKAKETSAFEDNIYEIYSGLCFGFSTFEYRQKPTRDLLEQITASWCYHAGTESTSCNINDAPDIIRQVVLSARYYVYVDDDDDHQSDTVSVNGHNDLIINSTLKMVA